MGLLELSILGTELPLFEFCLNFSWSGLEFKISLYCILGKLLANRIHHETNPGAIHVGLLQYSTLEAANALIVILEYFVANPRHLRILAPNLY